MPVVAQGVDYAFSHPSIASLVAGGKSFAVRYLYPFSQNPGTKNLTRGEADQLNAALTHGVVSNYESYAERAAEGFAAGVADARAADAQHRACGGPPDRPIYFSVDFDPVASQYPGIGDYFRGVISVIGLARTGAYGSYNMIKWLFDQRLIVWGWQTYAWSAGQYDERCQLSQDKNGVPMGGGEVDLDAAHAADFGQWNYKGTPGGDDMSAEAEAKITDIHNWLKGAKIPAGQTNLGSTIAATLPAVQGTFNKVNAVSTQVGAVPTTAEMVALLAKIGVEIKLTPEQLAALAAELGKLAAPDYHGQVTISPVPATPASAPVE